MENAAITHSKPSTCTRKAGTMNVMVKKFLRPKASPRSACTIPVGKKFWTWYLQNFWSFLEKVYKQYSSQKELVLLMNQYSMVLFPCKNRDTLRQPISIPLFHTMLNILHVSPTDSTFFCCGRQSFAFPYARPSFHISGSPCTQTLNRRYMIYLCYASWEWVGYGKPILRPASCSCRGDDPWAGPSFQTGKSFFQDGGIIRFLHRFPGGIIHMSIYHQLS